MSRLVALYGIANDENDLLDVIVLGEYLGYEVVPMSPFGKIELTPEDTVIAFSMGALALEEALSKGSNKPSRAILLNPVQKLRIPPMKKKYNKGYDSPNKWWRNIPKLIWKLLRNHKYVNVKKLQNVVVYVAADDDMLIHRSEFWDNMLTVEGEQHNSLTSSKILLDDLAKLLAR